MCCVFQFLIASQAVRLLCSVRCVVCVAYDNLETAGTPMKTDLKVGFQAALRNGCNARWSYHTDQKNPTHAHEKRNARREQN